MPAYGIKQLAAQYVLSQLVMWQPTNLDLVSGVSWSHKDNKLGVLGFLSFLCMLKPMKGDV